MAEFRTAVAVGVGWTAAQKWLVRISGVLTFVVLSRLLGPDDIGLVALALAFLGVLGVVADLGAATFLVQTRSWDERTRSTTFWTTLTLSLLATGLVVGLAAPLAAVLGEPRLAPVFQALAPILVLSVTSAVPTAILQRELRFRELALREMAAGLISAVVGVGLAVAGAGVWALVGQSGTQALVSAVLVWRMSAWRPTGQVSREAFTELRRFGGPVLAVNLLQSVRDRLEQFLLGALVGVTALGYWTVAVRLLALLVEVSVAVLDSVTLPVFAAARTTAERFRRAFEYALSATQVLLVPALALLAVASPVLLPGLRPAVGRVDPARPGALPRLRDRRARLVQPGGAALPRPVRRRTAADGGRPGGAPRPRRGGRPARTHRAGLGVRRGGGRHGAAGRRRPPRHARNGRRHAGPRRAGCGLRGAGVGCGARGDAGARPGAGGRRAPRRGGDGRVLDRGRVADERGAATPARRRRPPAAAQASTASRSSTSPTGRARMTRAGTPAASVCGGTSARTSEPAATTAPAPMVTPPSTVTLAPSQAPSPMTIGACTRGRPGPAGLGLVARGEQRDAVGQRDVAADRDVAGGVDQALVVEERAVADGQPALAGDPQPAEHLEVPLHGDAGRAQQADP